MSKTEINECMELNNDTIRKLKKKVRQLTDIRKTMSEICPAVSLDNLDDEIATTMAEIDEAKARNVKRKKQLKLLEQLEALENE